MNAEGGAARDRLRRFVDRAGNPLEWDESRKLPIMLGIAAAIVIPYVFRFAYVLDHPEVEPYFNRPMLRQSMWVMSAFLLANVVLVSLGLWLQRVGWSSRLLLHVVNQIWWLMFVYAIYISGPVTTPFWLVFVLIGCGWLLLFGGRIAFSGMATSLVLLAGITIAERLGAIPYAPVLDSWPELDGRLYDSFVISHMIWPAAASLATLSVVALLMKIAREQKQELAKASDQLARASELISRYVAAQVTERIFSGDYDAVNRHVRRRLTVFFSDIKDFTSTAEQMEPEDLSQILNEYLSEMTTIAERHDGTIDKFVGDAIMIFFGAPGSTDDADHALRAVRMAIEMQARIAELRNAWVGRGIQLPFRVRMGINTGLASVGNFGSEGRMDYTAIGRHVNLAARLEVACEPGRVLISHATWALVRDEIPCTTRGEISVKGVREPVRIYEVAPAGG